MDEAVRILDERKILVGKVKGLGPDLGPYILAFRFPDKIQLELTASYS